MEDYPEIKIKNGSKVNLEAVKSVYRRLKYYVDNVEHSEFVCGQLEIIKDILEGRFTK